MSSDKLCWIFKCRHKYPTASIHSKQLMVQNRANYWTHFCCCYKLLFTMFRLDSSIKRESIFNYCCHVTTRVHRLKLTIQHMDIHVQHAFKYFFKQNTGTLIGPFFYSLTTKCTFYIKKSHLHTCWTSTTQYILKTKEF